MPLSSAQLTRAQALLKMMGSSFEGERNNAAGLFHKLMKDAGVSDAEIPMALSSRPITPQCAPWEDEPPVHKGGRGHRYTEEYERKRQEQADNLRRKAEEERKASSTTVEWLAACAELMSNSFSLNERETQFVLSLTNQLNQGLRDYPTIPQGKWFRDIYKKILRKECPL